MKHRVLILCACSTLLFYVEILMMKRILLKKK